MDDLAAFMDPALRLPIGGHEYEIHCSAWQGLHLHRLFSEPGRVLDDNAERAEILQMLGDTYQQMVDDGIGWPRIAYAARAALFWFGISPDAGRRYWESGGDAAPGNPLPSSPNQGAMGERLSQIFRTQPRADRLLLTTARRSSPASAPESVEEPSPADPAPTAPTTPAAAHTSKRRGFANGSTPSPGMSVDRQRNRQPTRGRTSSSTGRTSNSTSVTAASTSKPASSANALGGGSNSASPTSQLPPPHDSTAHSAERNPDGT